MLIMSQYKKMLIPFEMIASLYVDGCEIKIAYLLTYKEDEGKLHLLFIFLY